MKRAKSMRRFKVREDSIYTTIEECSPDSSAALTFAEAKRAALTNMRYYRDEWIDAVKRMNALHRDRRRKSLRRIAG